MKLNNISKAGRIRMPMAVIFLLLLLLVGCATSGSVRQTLPGDIADIHFQCMLPI